MAARYELKRTANAQFMWNLKVNGEPILTSETYVSKQGALNGIASCRENSPFDSRYDRKTSISGQPYFVLLGANYQVIGTSEMYSSRTAMENGIASCKTNGRNAQLDDQT